MDLPQVEYSDERVDLLVLSIGLVIILYFLSKRFAMKRVLLFGNFETLERVMGKKILPTGLFVLVLRLLAVILVLMALSDVKVARDSYISKTDFVLAVDTSASMMTGDYEPTRLDAVKEGILGWVDKLEGTKVGLVTFSGRAYVKLRPTWDMDEVKEGVRKIHWEEPAGTAIGDAIVAASSLLDGGEEGIVRNNTIIIITDGRNNGLVNITTALKSVNSSHIKILVIGVGSKGVTENEIPSGLIGLNATATEFPNLDEDMLRYIANETGGSYMIIDTKNSIKRAFESALEYRKISKSIDKDILMALCLILLIEWGFEITRYRPIP